MSLQEFVEAYFEQQMQVEQRIEELTKLVEEDTKKRQEIVGKLEEIQASEQVNEFGIMLNSILTATIIEGRGLKGSASFIVVLGVEEQKAQSERVGAANGDPVWNEVVTFDIVTGREPLYI